VFSFGIILALALLGIGVGSSFHGFFASRGRSSATLLGFAGICLAEAAAIAFPSRSATGWLCSRSFYSPSGVLSVLGPCRGLGGGWLAS